MLIVSGDLRGVIVTGEIDIAATSLLDSPVRYGLSYRTWRNCWPSAVSLSIT